MYSESISVSPYKIAARAEGIRLYRDLSGNHFLPEDKQYWCLSARQTKADDSEINQLTYAGLISPWQFHGVDRDNLIIAANRLDHPTAHWYAGEWVDVVTETDWNPGLIYLDTISLAGNASLNVAATTLRLCPAKTAILLNVMQTHPYSDKAGMNAEEFLSALGKRVPNLPDWCPDSGIQHFEYVANYTQMRTYAFWREQ